MELIAKPVVDNQFWIITDGNKKVGNIQANSAGFSATLNGKTIQFTSPNELSNDINVKFETITVTKNKADPIFKYPTTSSVFNSIFDVKRNLHLYTKSQHSDCYYAAGWFVLNKRLGPVVSFCPKNLMLLHWTYSGPFMTKEEAQDAAYKEIH